MAYELIALDMDGTLLDSRKQVLPGSMEAIAQAAAAGKTVAIASGRCPSMVSMYRDELPGVRYAICCAGAVVYDLMHDSVMAETDLSPEFVARALGAADEEGFYILEVTSGRGVIMQEDEVARCSECGVGIYQQLYRDTSTFVDDARAWALEPGRKISKLNFHFAEAAARDRVRERLENPDVVITNCETSSIEFAAAGVDKGTGLATLCDLLGLGVEQAIAVGDAENDVSMLRRAGLGAAMGNALPCAVSAANVQVADNDHGGVAEVIQRFLLAE